MNYKAKLMLKCPYCKRQSNEYNWSLQTASRYSIGAETCPTVIMVLLETINGNKDAFDGFRLVCPRCYHGVDFEELSLPPKEDILHYADEVGDEYCQAWL